MKIGDLIEGRYLIYIGLWFGLGCLHRLPSILFRPQLFFYLTLTTMSDIYCHEDIIDFTNPFLNFEQGYQAPRKIPTIPVSPKTVLLEVPSTCRGYPRGESQGDSSGWCPSLLPFDGCTDRLPGKIPGLFAFSDAELILSKPLHRKGNHHHPTDEEWEAQDKRLFVYRYNQGERRLAGIIRPVPTRLILASVIGSRPPSIAISLGSWVLGTLLWLGRRGGGST